MGQGPAQPQQWNFQQLDQEVALAQTHSTPVEVVLGMTPRWAALRPDLVSDLWKDRPGLVSPPQLEAWATYVRTVARRYKGKVRAYEIWNEPITPLYWEGSPAQLAEITRIAAEIIHTEDPNAIVGSPSGGAVKDQYRDYVAWFEEFLQAGGAKGVDVMIWHFYTDQAPEGPFRQELQTVRQMLDRHGLQAKPLWITEGGFLNNPKVTPTRPAEPPDREAALHLSRYMLVGAVQGMDAFYFYTWDYADANVFAMSQPPKGHTPAAQTWLQVQRWLVGAQVLGLSRSPDGVWAIRLRRNGAEGYIVWDTDSEQPIALPAQWQVRQVADLNGTVTRLDGRSAGIGQLPRLFF
jgi:Glycosyl hydrolase catalytic core